MQAGRLPTKGQTPLLLIELKMFIKTPLPNLQSHALLQQRLRGFSSQRKSLMIKVSLLKKTRNHHITSSLLQYK
jgi:hypothetical protein